MCVVMKLYLCACGQVIWHLIFSIATCLSSLSLSAVGEGADPQRYEARYHSQGDVVDQLRGEGGCKEGDGLRVGAGLGCDEPRVEVAEGTFYENITR